MNKILTLVGLHLSQLIFAANITVNYNNSANQWPPAAVTAFDEAILIWEETIFSPYEIVIDARYENLSVTLGSGFSNVLGVAKAYLAYSNFGSSHSAYYSNTSYVVALAEKLDGSQFEVPYHIEVRMNSTPAWDYSINFDPTQNHYDFISTALHEIAHGLGFVSSSQLSLTTNSPSYNATTPTIMDREIVRVNSGTTHLTALADTGATTESFLTSNQVYYDGTFAVIANGSSKPKLYAPTTWQQGSSISHWDQGSFGAQDHDALMHPMAPQIQTSEWGFMPTTAAFISIRCAAEPVNWAISSIHALPKLGRTAIASLALTRG